MILKRLNEKRSTRSTTAGALALFMLAGLCPACGFVFGDFEVGEDAGGTGGTGPGSDDTPSCDGTFRCSGATLESCDGNTWASVKTCPSAETCDAAAKDCVAAGGGCSEGAKQCQGADLQVCTAGEWATEETCRSADLCYTDNARKTVSCTECVVGSRSCLGGDLQVCGRTSDGWAINTQDCGGFDCRIPDAGAAYCPDCDTVGQTVCSPTTGTIRRCNGRFEYEIDTECPDGCEAGADGAVCL